MMLLEASARGDFALIETLVLAEDENGRSARLEYRNRHNGWTALHYAAANGHLSCVSMLLQLGANPSVGTGRRKDRITPLHLAASSGFDEIVALLVHAGAVVSRPDLSGFTAREHAGMMAEQLSNIPSLRRRDCELVLRVQETKDAWESLQIVPERIIRSDALDMNPELSRIVSVSVGGSERVDADFAMFVTLRGSLLTWGCGEFGQLGRVGDKINHFEKLTSVPALRKQGVRVEQAACGVRHSIILLSTGHVCTAGDGFNGQLGLGNEFERTEQFVPLHIPNPVKVQSVAAGLFHSVIVLCDGRVMSFGSNKRGQCGTGDRGDKLVPTCVQLPEGTGRGPKRSADNTIRRRRNEARQSMQPRQVCYAVCGEMHTIVVVRREVKMLHDEHHDGAVFEALVCGKALCSGQGSDEEQDDLLVLRDLKGYEVATVAAGANHTALITPVGTLFTWGAGRCGQLGHGDRSRQLCPKLVGFFVEGKCVRKTLLVSVAAGSRHTIAMDDSGRIFAMGSNTYGQLGRGDRKDNLLPKQLTICVPNSEAEKLWHEENCGDDPPHPVLIGAGGCCTMVVLACGDTTHVVHFGSRTRQARERLKYPDNLWAQPVPIPDEDSDDEFEKKRKLRRKLRALEGKGGMGKKK